MRAAFLGLARNCEASTPNVRKLIGEFLSYEHDLEVFLGENGSTDSTRSILEQYQKELPCISIIDTSRMSSVSDRLERMALGRELLKEACARSHLAAPFDYVIVCDLDNVLREAISAASIVSAIKTLETEDDLFAVSAKSKPYYYDILALHDPKWFNHDASRYFRSLAGIPFGKILLIGLFIFPWQRRLTAAGDFEAHSSFNGLAIYKTKAFFEASYVKGAPSPAPCEHLVLNRSIARKTGQRIRALDSLLVSMPPEHGPRGLKWLVERAKYAFAQLKL